MDDTQIYKMINSSNIEDVLLIIGILGKDYKFILTKLNLVYWRKSVYWGAFYRDRTDYPSSDKIYIDLKDEDIKMIWQG